MALNLSVVLFTGVSHPASFNRAQGAYRLASQLRSHGHQTRVIDAIGSLPVDKIKEMLELLFLNQKNIKLIGFSTSFLANLKTKIHEDTLVTEDYLPYEYSQWMTLIDFIKTKTNAKIVVGGHKANLFEKDLKNHSYIDHVVYGYSDAAILKLLSGKESARVITELVPDEHFDFHHMVNRYDPKDSFLDGESFTIEMQRGCIYRCKFCAYPLNGKKKSSWTRNVSQLVDELVYCQDHFKSKNFILNSDTLNDDYDYLNAFSKELRQRNLRYNFAVNARIDLFTDQKMIDLVKEIGVRTVLFGLESSSKTVLNRINKFFDFEKANSLLHQCKKSWQQQIKITGSYIVGLPYDTESNVQDIFNYFESSDCPIDSIEFDPLFVTNPALDLNPWKSDYTINAQKHGFTFKDNSFLEWSNPVTPYLNFEQTNQAVKNFNSRLSFQKAKSIKSAAYTHLPNNFGHELDAAQKFEDVFKCITYDDYKALLKNMHSTTIDKAKNATLEKYFHKFLEQNS